MPRSSDLILEHTHVLPSERASEGLNLKDHSSFGKHVVLGLAAPLPGRRTVVQQDAVLVPEVM